MLKNKLLKEQPVQTGDNEVSTIYGDLVTFIMMLFILLFVLAYNEQQDETFFTKMRLQFGGKTVEQTNKVTGESILISNLQGYIKENQLEKDAQLLIDEQKIKLILYPSILFNSGEAELKQKGKLLLDNLSQKIKDIKNPIIVEGHTDSIPIKTKEFESNWILSFHRSYNVVKHLINRHHFSPKQLSAQGYGEHQPLFSNDTKENRAKNRRIEINIIRISKNQSL